MAGPSLDPIVITDEMMASSEAEAATLETPAEETPAGGEGAPAAGDRPAETPAEETPAAAETPAGETPAETPAAVETPAAEAPAAESALAAAANKLAEVADRLAKPAEAAPEAAAPPEIKPPGWIQRMLDSEDPDRQQDGRDAFETYKAQEMRVQALEQKDADREMEAALAVVERETNEALAKYVVPVSVEKVVDGKKVVVKELQAVPLEKYSVELSRWAEANPEAAAILTSEEIFARIHPDRELKPTAPTKELPPRNAAGEFRRVPGSPRHTPAAPTARGGAAAAPAAAPKTTPVPEGATVEQAVDIGMRDLGIV